MRLRRVGLMFGLYLVLVANQFGIQRWIWDRPEYQFGIRVNVPAAYQAGQFSNFFVAMAAFRNIAANLLWVKTDEYWHDGRWYRVLPIMDAIVRLDPQFLIVWETYAWHCAYNLNTAAQTRAQKEYWLERGAQVLRQGIRENPKKWDLYGELGHLYYERIGDWDQAAYWFRKSYDIFNQFPDENQDFHVQKVIHSLAHIYEITWDIPEARRWWQISHELDPSDPIPNIWQDFWRIHENDLARKDEVHARERQKRANRGMLPFKPTVTKLNNEQAGDAAAGTPSR